MQVGLVTVMIEFGMKEVSKIKSETGRQYLKNLIMGNCLEKHGKWLSVQVDISYSYF